MKIETLSIVVGGLACFARCPFCIAKMTTEEGILKLGLKHGVRWDRFETALRMAERCGVTTALLTGKGEPTLWPDLIERYLEKMDNSGNFGAVPGRPPLIELQTNGTLLPGLTGNLEGWANLGLTTVALSCVHHEHEPNAEIYSAQNLTYPGLPELIKLVHTVGLSVRLTAMLTNKFCQVDDLSKMVGFCYDHGVEQLTFRPVNTPYTSDGSHEAHNWTFMNRPPKHCMTVIEQWLDAEGIRVLELPYGAVVYDLGGQNVCLSNCLTLDKSSEEMRSLIFFPNGSLRWSWEFEGARLL